MKKFMKKHILSILLVLLLVFTLFGCGKKRPEIAVMEMPAYIAAPVGEERLFAFTFFTLTENEELIEQIKGMTFVNFGDEAVEMIDVKDSSIECIAAEDTKYTTYALYITCQGKKTGLQKVDELVFLLDGKNITIPMEEVVFDFGEDTGAAYADTWESPAASSNAAELVCSYTYDEAVDAVRIYYGEDDYVELTADEIAKGEVYIPLDNDAFINYICTKVELEVDGEVYTTYGHGCYCGAMSVDDDTMEQMWMND